MIDRVWAARTTAANAPVYVEHLRDEVIPTLRRLDGYLGARLLQREVGYGVEIVVVTRWQSLDAVRGFAGEDIERAVVTDKAAAQLTGYDDRVAHFEVVLTDDV